MSQQLSISSLFSTLALVLLALFARAGDMPELGGDAEPLVTVQVATNFDS